MNPIQLYLMARTNSYFTLVVGQTSLRKKEIIEITSKRLLWDIYALSRLTSSQDYTEERKRNGHSGKWILSNWKHQTDISLGISLYKGNKTSKKLNFFFKVKWLNRTIFTKHKFPSHSFHQISVIIIYLFIFLNSNWLIFLQITGENKYVVASERSCCCSHLDGTWMKKNPKNNWIKLVDSKDNLLVLLSFILCFVAAYKILKISKW